MNKKKKIYQKSDKLQKYSPKVEVLRLLLSLKYLKNKNQIKKKTDTIHRRI